MSKLLNKYTELKKKDSNKIYLFPVGIFYNILNEDARTVSKTIGLKITKLSPDLIKCGFPIAKLNKYTNLFKSHNLDFEIVPVLTPTNQITSDVIEKIKNIDLNNTTCIEAFNLLYSLQQKLKNIQ